MERNALDRAKRKRLRELVIAVDFDGTLVSDDYPDIGEPNTDLIESLKALRKKDVMVILWTCRNGYDLKQAVEAMDLHGLEFDAINSNPRSLVESFNYSDPRKVGADIYIDDKACGVLEFLEIMKEV